MLTKTKPDEIQDFLGDASYLAGGFTSAVFFPKSAEEVARTSGEATRINAGHNLRCRHGHCWRSSSLRRNRHRHGQTESHQECRSRREWWHAVAEAGVRLIDLQRAVEADGLLYPPDPTERTCFLGGTIATNASGSRTFKYGPTRNYVERLKIALATGDVIDLRRGELRAADDGQVTIPLSSGRTIDAKLPAYQMPNVRKHASGYFVAPGMDVIDLSLAAKELWA